MDEITYTKKEMTVEQSERLQDVLANAGAFSLTDEERTDFFKYGSILDAFLKEQRVTLAEFRKKKDQFWMIIDISDDFFRTMEISMEDPSTSSLEESRIGKLDLMTLKFVVEIILPKLRDEN